MMPRSHIEKMKQNLLAAATDDWQTVAVIARATPYDGNDGMVRVRLDQLVTAGELEVEIKVSATGRTARHYRRKPMTEQLGPIYSPAMLRERADLLSALRPNTEQTLIIWAFRVAANALEAARLGIDNHPETSDWSEIDRQISAMNVVATIHSDMAERLASS